MTEKVVFAGIIDKKIQKFVIKKRQRHAAGLLFCVFFAVGILYLMLQLWKLEQMKSSGILLILLAVLDLFLFFAPVNENQLRFHWNFTVELEDGVIRSIQHQNGQEVRMEKPLSKVKRVLDYGTFYCVIYLDFSSCIVCERSLLREGSVEAFEALFDGKIIKKDQK